MKASASNGKVIESGDKVLVRSNSTAVWVVDTFSYMSGDDYICTGYKVFKECIPYKGNEDLCGTSKPSFTGNFIPKFGDKVRVTFNKNYVNEYVQEGYIIENRHAGSYSMIVQKPFGDGKYTYCITGICAEDVIEKI